MPSETAEPTYGAQSCGCVFIKALQSKDFSEILLICANFLVIVHGSSDFPGKIDILFSGHKKYYWRITILGMESLRKNKIMVIVAKMNLQSIYVSFT